MTLETLDGYINQSKLLGPRRCFLVEVTNIKCSEKIKGSTSQKGSSIDRVVAPTLRITLYSNIFQGIFTYFLWSHNLSSEGRIYDSTFVAMWQSTFCLGAFGVDPGF